MGKRKSVPRLSPGEMEIMQIVWEHGSVTIAEAHRALGRPISYPTVQTRLNRLVEKRILAKSKDRPAQYRAAVARQEVGARHLDQLLERVSGGKVVPLVAHLVKDRSLSPEEFVELKKLIAEAERESRNR